MNGSYILETGALTFGMRVQNPFVACMHHQDAYPTGNRQMEPTYYIEGREQGNDFDHSAPWRMYHGETVPGFPVHPHRGFETVTVVLRGFVDHSDSHGATGRYGDGDVQWMTAGAGLQHAEMFPLLSETGENPLELFQVWLNLPRKSKFADPHYKMLWNEEIPVLDIGDPQGRKTTLRLIAGQYGEAKAPPPNPASWAADPANHVGIWLLTLEPGAVFTIPAVSETLSRTLYYYEGDTLTADDALLQNRSYAHLAGGADITLRNGAAPSKLLLLEGEPINEPVVSRGPFVMNSPEEIAEAFADYRATRFGGWPWARPDPVNPREQGRFARYKDGSLHLPPKKP